MINWVGWLLHFIYKILLAFRNSYLRSTNDEVAARVDVNNSFVGEVLSWNDLFDNLLSDFLTKSLQCDLQPDVLCYCNIPDNN